MPPPNPPRASLISQISKAEVVQCGQEAADFFRRVVVGQADAQHAASRLDAQPLAQIQRVIVPVPGEDPTLAEVACQLRGEYARPCEWPQWERVGQNEPDL